LILNVNNNYYAFGNSFWSTAPFYGVCPLQSKKKNIFLYKIFSPISDRKYEDRRPAGAQLGSLTAQHGTVATAQF
jgi:hypothetical protein